jgi:hypothetical protein
MRKSLVLLIVAALSLAFAPAPVFRSPAPRPQEAGAAKIDRAMLGFRTKMPPAVGMAEQNGLSVKELEPFITSHLAGVARRMGVKTRAECRALMPYLEDHDGKLRYIAHHAINEATKAYPNGTSVAWVLDTHSEGHGKMTRRFAELIAQLEP